jgi:hypothetical protein
MYNGNIDNGVSQMDRKTAEGFDYLPLRYLDFCNRARKLSPTISDAELVKAWERCAFIFKLTDKDILRALSK